MLSKEWEEWACQSQLLVRLPLALNSPLVWPLDQWTWLVYSSDSMLPSSATLHCFCATEDALSLQQSLFKVFCSTNSQITSLFSAHAWWFQELLLPVMIQWLIMLLDSCSFGPQTSSRLSKTSSLQSTTKTSKLLLSRSTSTLLASGSQSCYSWQCNQEISGLSLTFSPVQTQTSASVLCSWSPEDSDSWSPWTSF